VISSFRLPDLVLGVSLKADTSGSRQAAQELKRSIQKEMGTIGGGKGGVGSGVAAGVAAGVAGNVGSRLEGLVKQFGLERTVMTAQNLAAVHGRAADIALAAGDMKAAVEQSLMAVSMSRLAKKAGDDMAEGMSRGMLRRLKMIAAAIAAAISGAVSYALYRIVVGSIRSALGYIKNVGAGGQYGDFREELYRIRAILTNVRVQFGLMLIDILRLGDVLRSLQPVLLRIVNLFMWFRESPKAQFAALLVALAAIAVALAAIVTAAGLAVAALVALAGVSLAGAAIAFLAVLGVILFTVEAIVATLLTLGWLKNILSGKMPFAGGPIATMVEGLKLVGKFLNWVLPKPKAGVDLGGGLSSRMGGAALEGSVEAYRTIQGTLMRYAAETARNTKEAAGALKEILNRAPAMGVVPG